MADTTTNFNFNLIERDRQPWHDDEHDNWRMVDALLARYLSLSNLQGVWDNATVYTVGKRVVDPDLGTIWECQVAHTSASTGTFAATRTAYPTYWEGISFQVNGRGTWATATEYQVNDFVVSGYIFAVCIVAHTSGSTFAADAANWTYLIDLTSIIASVNSTLAAANAAVAAITLPLAVASGGTGQTTIAGVAGTLTSYFQAANAVLTTLTGASANGQSLITAADYSAMRTLLGLGALALLNTVTSTQIDDNAVTLAKLATQAANTVLVNATASAAVPTALALSASTVLGRDASGNISALTLSGLTATSGVLAVAGGWEFVSSQEASASSTIDFTSLASGYDYMIGLSNVDLSATADIYLRYGTGAGPTYQTANYLSGNEYVVSIPNAAQWAYSQSADTGGVTSAIRAHSYSLGFSDTLPVAGMFAVFNPARNAATQTEFKIVGFIDSTGVSGSAGQPSAAIGGGYRSTAEVVTALRVLPSTGNFASGLFSLYRRKNQ